jgi:hypothetical protein
VQQAILNRLAILQTLVYVDFAMETTSTPTKQAETKYCFSYIRFSSKKQELGSSLERQEPIAERVAREHGWQYMPKWNAKNLGVSAYKGCIGSA